MKKFLLIGLSALPLAAFGAAGDTSQLTSFVNSIKTTVNAIIPVLVSLALVAFFWGLIKFLFMTNGDEDGRKDARQMMIYAVIALFVMTAIWGLVGFIGSSTGIDSNAGAPTIKIPSTSGI